MQDAQTSREGNRYSGEQIMPSSPARDIHAKRPLDRLPVFAEPSSASRSSVDSSHSYRSTRPTTISDNDGDAASPPALNLLNIPQGNRSTSSLMDAVFGDTLPVNLPVSHPAQPTSSHPASTSAPSAYHRSSSFNHHTSTTPIRSPPMSTPSQTVSPLQAARPIRRRSRKEAVVEEDDKENDDPTYSENASASASASASHTETDSWDKMSDVEREQDEEQVRKLEQTVNKRRSVLPALELELAALNEQIRAAEERLARAQNAGPTSSV